MDNRTTTDQKEKRIAVRTAVKAWRYIHDITSTDAGNLDRKALEDGSGQLAMAMHSAVDRCAVVPMMEKRIHDTVPVFYVIPTVRGKGAAESIRQAFVDVYVRDKKIGADNIPTQFMLVEDIPLNANGKLDIFRITRERIGGEAYDLVPVFKDGELTDIQTKYVESVNSMTAGTVPHGMENHSAYNMFDFFNAAAPSGRTKGSFFDDLLGIHDPFGIFGALFSDEDKSRKRSSMPEMPESVRKAILKYGNRMVGRISTERKKIDFDFED